MASPTKNSQQRELSSYPKQLDPKGMHNKSSAHVTTTTIPVFQAFHPPSTDPKILNESLTSRDIKPMQFFNILDEHLDSFNEVNVATFWHRLAKHNDRWKISFDDPRLKAITYYTYKILNQLNARGLSNIIWALSTLRCTDNNLIDALKTVIGSKLEENHQLFDAQGLSNITWAFANLKYIDNSFINVLKTAIRSKLDENPQPFEAQALSNITLAFAKFGCSDNNFIDTLQTVIGSRIDDHNFFNVLCLTNITWSFVMLKMAKKYIRFIQYILTKIDTYLKTGETFPNENIIHQLLQIREILPIEAPMTKITWSKALEDKIDTFRRSLVPPTSSMLHNSIFEHLAKELKGNVDFETYELLKEQYVLGYFIDNTLISKHKKIAIEVCGPCHYYRDTKIPATGFETKQYLLQNAGWSVIKVPYFIWDSLKTDKEKSSYIIPLLKEATQSPINNLDTESSHSETEAQSNVVEQLSSLKDLYLKSASEPPKPRRVISSLKKLAVESVTLASTCTNPNAKGNPQLSERSPDDKRLSGSEEKWHNAFS